MHLPENIEKKKEKKLKINKERLLNPIDDGEKTEIIVKEIKTPIIMTKNIEGIQQKDLRQKAIRGVNDENSYLFYNSLSLIMLSMLAGGLVGVIFILYFTFKKEYHGEELN